MKLVVISSTKGTYPETKIVTEMFDNGLETFHLRKPSFNKKKMGEYINQIPEPYWHKIIIHSKHILAIKFNLGGIHFTKKHRKNKLRSWLTKKYIKQSIPKIKTTTSFHSLESLIETDKKYDYVFLSPVFDSISKSKYQGKFKDQNFNVFLKKVNQKVYALGGINASKVEKVKSMDFQGIALHGVIWESENPIKTFNEIKEKCKVNPKSYPSQDLTLQEEQVS